MDNKQAKAIAAAYHDAAADQQSMTKIDLALALQKDLAPIIN
jgi:hypothetical protein